VETERCFASVSEGMLAGYALAPPPAGTVVVEGVYLQAVDDEYWDSTCQRAADRLGFAVPCPGRLPNRPAIDRGPTCRASYADRTCVLWDAAFVFEQEDFAVPPGYRGGPSGGGPKADLTIAAYRRGAIERVPEFEYLFECTGGATEGTVEVLGQQGVWSAEVVACPLELAGATLLFGDTILRWESNEIVYVVALAGDDDTTILLAKAIAGNVRFVEPAG
jgi:hypothetical protein